MIGHRRRHIGIVDRDMIRMVHNGMAIYWMTQMRGSGLARRRR